MSETVRLNSNSKTITVKEPQKTQQSIPAQTQEGHENVVDLCHRYEGTVQADVIPPPETEAVLKRVILTSRPTFIDDKSTDNITSDHSSLTSSYRLMFIRDESPSDVIESMDYDSSFNIVDDSKQAYDELASADTVNLVKSSEPPTPPANVAATASAAADSVVIAVGTKRQSRRALNYCAMAAVDAERKRFAFCNRKLRVSGSRTEVQVRIKAIRGEHHQVCSESRELFDVSRSMRTLTLVDEDKDKTRFVSEQESELVDNATSNVTLSSPLCVSVDDLTRNFLDFQHFNLPKIPTSVLRDASRACHNEPQSEPPVSSSRDLQQQQQETPAVVLMTHVISSETTGKCSVKRSSELLKNVNELVPVTHDCCDRSSPTYQEGLRLLLRKQPRKKKSYVPDMTEKYDSSNANHLTRATTSFILSQADHIIILEGSPVSCSSISVNITEKMSADEVTTTYYQTATDSEAKKPTSVCNVNRRHDDNAYAESGTFHRLPVEPPQHQTSRFSTMTSSDVSSAVTVEFMSSSTFSRHEAPIMEVTSPNNHLAESKQLVHSHDFHSRSPSSAMKDQIPERRIMASSKIGVKLPHTAAVKVTQVELQHFETVVEKPARPFLAIVGGASVSDKIQLIENMLDKVDEIIIGGGLAFTFLKVLYNMEIGKSLFDEEACIIIPKLMEKATAKNVTITLPVDFVTGDKFCENAAVGQATVASGIKAPALGLDIGPQSAKLFSDLVIKSATVVWKGPLGVFEWTNFSRGSEAVLKACVDATKKGATVIIDGGETTTAWAKWKREENVALGREVILLLVDSQNNNTASPREDVCDVGQTFFQQNSNNNAVVGKRSGDDADIFDYDEEPLTKQHSSRAAPVTANRCTWITYRTTDVTKHFTPEQLALILFSPETFQNKDSSDEILMDDTYEVGDRQKKIFEPIKAYLNKDSYGTVAAMITEKEVCSISELRSLVGEHLSVTAENWFLRRGGARHTFLLVAVNHDATACGVIGFSSGGIALELKNFRRALDTRDLRVFEYNEPLWPRDVDVRIDIAMSLLKPGLILPTYNLKDFNCECFVHKLMINADNLSLQAHDSWILAITPSFILYGGSLSSYGNMR